MHKDQKKVVGHAAVYLLARGVPGVLAFLSIPLFTRLLDADGYGKFALVIATVSLGNALLFQWLRLALVRYLPGCSDDPDRLKGTLLTCELLLAGGAGVVALGICCVPALAAWRAVTVTTWGVLAVQPVFELFSEHARAMIQPWHYMALQVGRAGLATGLGALFIVLGMGWWGPVLGIAAGMLLPAVFAYRRDWKNVRLGIDREVLKSVSRYGLPLSLTVGLTVVISSSDRFLIAWYLGDGAAGVYSVAVDFTTQTLTLLMMVVYMAMFPLAVRAWEKQGRDAAREQMRHNAALLLAIGLPSVVGLSVLAPGITYCLMGPAFRQGAAAIMPLIAFGAFLAGYKAYHLDAAFQFVHKTMYQVWIVLIAAVANVALNLVLIKPFGINGSAAAAVIAYVLSMVLTASYGRRHFKLPFPVRSFAQVALACLTMALVLYPIHAHRGAAWLAVQVALGGAAYGAMLLATNFLDLRGHLLQKLIGRAGESVATPAAALD